MATKTKKGAIARVVESAVDAAEEIGQAAASFKESWSHVKRAQRKAEPATRAAKRTGSRVVKATKSATRRVTKAVKKRR